MRKTQALRSIWDLFCQIYMLNSRSFFCIFSDFGKQTEEEVAVFGEYGMPVNVIMY